MSIRWISHVWESSPYEGRRLLLHLALADFANDEGVCFPSQKTLALKARTTETWVGSTVRQMVKDGLLEIVERGNGRGRASTYRLLKGTTELTLSEKGASLETERYKNDDTCLYKNQIEPSNSIGHQFDLFWAKYPRKVAKVAARNVFTSLMRKKDAPTIETLLNAVDAYAKRQVDMKYVAHPATWLRQGRWEDEEPKESPSQSTVRDWHLDSALDRVVPFAHLGRSWDDCLDAIRDFDPRVVEPCREVYENIRRAKS